LRQDPRGRLNPGTSSCPRVYIRPMSSYDKKKQKGTQRQLALTLLNMMPVAKVVPDETRATPPSVIAKGAARSSWH
jgi:hypothetical protein